MTTLRHSKLGLILFTLALVLTANMALTAIQPSTVAADTAESISINGGAQFTNTPVVQLTLTSSTAVQMQFSNDETTWSDWEAFATLKDWNLSLDESLNKFVFVNFKDASGQVTTANSSIILDDVPPTPNVYVSVSSAEDNDLFFDGGLSFDNIGISSYVWDFGDGQNGTGVTATHAYAENGTFYGNLTVTDLAGNSAFADFWVKLPVTVQPTATPAPTPVPTEIRTPIPTPTPSIQPTPDTQPFALSPLMLTVIVAFIVIVVVGVAVLLAITRSKSKSPPAA